MQGTSSSAKTATLAGLIAAALAVVAPFSVRGVACGHDLVFHMNSWLEVAQQWREGVVFPRWAPAANYLSGEPRFLFYPPLSWMLGGALGSFIPWLFVPVAFDFCIVVLAGWTMFITAREWLEPRDAGLIAVAYAVNPYLLLCIYARSSYGELLASTFFPLLLLWIVRDRPARNMLVPLALTLAAVWLTNVPSALIATYWTVFLLALVTVLRRNSRVFLYGSGGLLLALALAAFFIVPAVMERSWISASQVLAPGVRPADNFLFATTADARHDAFLRTVSWLALGEILVSALAVFAARRWRQRNEKLWWALVSSATLAFLLMLPVAAPVFRYLPNLQFVQFPWRCLLIIGLTYAVFVGTALPWFRGKPWLYALALLALIAGCNRGFQTQCDPAETPFMISNLYHTGYGYMGSDEYTPAGGDNYEIQPDFPEYRLRRDDGTPAPDARVSQFHGSTYGKQLAVDSPEPVQLELRLMNYPAWRVEVNGKRVTPQSDDPTGRMVIALPAGRSDVDVRFLRTRDQWIGDAISLVAVLVLVAVCFHHRDTETQRKKTF